MHGLQVKNKPKKPRYSIVFTSRWQQHCKFTRLPVMLAVLVCSLLSLKTYVYIQYTNILSIGILACYFSELLVLSV